MPRASPRSPTTASRSEWATRKARKKKEPTTVHRNLDPGRLWKVEGEVARGQEKEYGKRRQELRPETGGSLVRLTMSEIFSFCCQLGVYIRSLPHPVNEDDWAKKKTDCEFDVGDQRSGQGGSPAKRVRYLIVMYNSLAISPRHGIADEDGEEFAVPLTSRPYK